MPYSRAAMTDEAYEVFNAGARPELVFVCDHAANALPEVHGTLGLGPEALSAHVAYDIGAAAVTRALARRFGAPAVLGRWSRLLVDLNRGPDDPTVVMKLSDGRVVPGNARAGADEIAGRIARYHAPYHAAIESRIAEAREADLVPILVSVHSFTPVWRGRKRPWHLGVLWDRDGRLAKPLLARLAREEGVVVGDNEPYSGELEGDCMYRHGTRNGLPHALVEIRQDLIADEMGVARWSARIGEALEDALAAMGRPSIRFTRALALEGGSTLDDKTRIELEAAVLRRLVAHLRERTDVQNIDLMIAGGFCRNCLGDWYRDAAADKGIALAKDEARALIYGMAPGEWKQKYQKEATPEQQAAFEASQKKTHS